MTKTKKTSNSAMVSRGSPYSDEQRRQCAIEYGIHGVLARVSEYTGVPESTLSLWKKTEWWDELTAEVRAVKATEMRANYQKLVLAAQDKALELLPNTTSAKEALLVAAVSTDKLRLADNVAPPSNVGGASALEALAKRFEQLARDNRVIAVQDKADDSDTDQ